MHRAPLIKYDNHRECLFELRCTAKEIVQDPKILQTQSRLIYMDFHEVCCPHKVVILVLRPTRDPNKDANHEIHSR